MPEPAQLVKARLREIAWQQQKVVERDREVEVQFNPETLKLSYAVQKSGGDQRGGAATQFLGTGTTKLTFDLWFDVSAPHQPATDDVRKLTTRIAYFMVPKTGETADAPPGVRFQWGTFLFEGVMDSLNESLELFSEDGRPLRANVSVSLSRQDVYFAFGDRGPSSPLARGFPGIRPLEPVRLGDTVQDLAARTGQAADWPRIAAANGIENPRRPPAGSFLDLRLAGAARRGSR